MGRGLSLVRRYVAASHPLPTLAVTGFVVALAVTIDLPGATVAVIALASIAGQVSIGWSNDLIDAERDARAGRTDKPLTDGRGRAALTTATASAVGVCILLSLSVGALAAACHLVGVACGWLYNLGLKSTAWSWAPYAVAFALLPTWVFAAQDGAPWAPAWMGVAAGTLGVSAHLVNAAPDIAVDRDEGIRGLPQRWGAATSVFAAFVLLVVGAVVGLVGPPGSPRPWTWGLLAIVVALGAAATAAVRSADRAERPLPRWTFSAMLVLVAVVVATILSAASS
jgi:4-hydroxybenzoate polyprenyltransferase